MSSSKYHSCCLRPRLNRLHTSGSICLHSSKIVRALYSLSVTETSKVFRWLVPEPFDVGRLPLFPSLFLIGVHHETVGTTFNYSWDFVSELGFAQPWQTTLVFQRIVEE